MKYLLKRIGMLVALTIIVGGIQFFIIDALRIRLFYSTEAIYVFHFLVTLFVMVGVYFVYRRDDKHTGYAFLVSSILRILVSVLFLIPLIKVNLADKMIDVLTFMIPYFIFLIFEAQYAICLMNQKKHT